jgi:hypothetical protein
MESLKVSIPEGHSGDWRVVNYEARPDPLNTIRLGEQGRNYVPGTYTGLFHGTELIMSDTPDECSDHLDAIHSATGTVLINGLGLGVVLQAVLRNPDVVHVDVVENSADVVTLVAPSYQDQRVLVHRADAFDIQWPTDARWDTVWHDIWPDISDEHVPQMNKLRRKYAGRCRWQGCWAEYMMRRLAREAAASAGPSALNWYPLSPTIDHDGVGGEG